MVGTRPTDSPAPCQDATRARRSPTRRTTSGPPGMLTSCCSLLRRCPENVLGTREAALAHFGGVSGGGLADLGAELGVAFDEFRFEVGEQAGDVLGDEHLAVAGGRSADADHGGAHTLDDLARQRLQHAFQYDI